MEISKMDSAFTHLKKMYDNELYEGVIPIVSNLLFPSNRIQFECDCQFSILDSLVPQATFMESTYDRDRTTLKPEQYFLMIMYHANSLFQLRHYRRADPMFRRGLEVRKIIVKARNTSGQPANADNAIEIFTDADICYKLALCLEYTKQIQEAINVLNWLPQRQRTIKINMLLGKLSQQAGRNINALICYKAVLRECPFYLDAIKNSLILGEKDMEIGSIISIGSARECYWEWSC